MLQLIINLDEKNNLISKESSSGSWLIYLHKNGQKNKVEEKDFSHYEMESELELAAKALHTWSKRIAD